MRNNNGRESYLVAGDKLVYDSELGEASKKNAALEKKVKQLQADLKNFKAEKKATERQESDAVCQSRVLQQEVQQWKARCIGAYETSKKEQLKSQEFQDSYCKEKKKFDDRSEDFQSNISGLSSELAAVQQEFEAAQGQLAAQLTGVKAENRKLAAQLTGVKAEKRQLAAQLTGVKAENRKLAAQLTVAQDEKRQLAAQLTVAQDEKRQLAAQLTVAQDEKRQLDAKCVVYNHSNMRLSDSSQVDRTTVATAQRELKTAQAVHNGKINQPSTEEAGCQWWNGVDDVVTKAECRKIAQGRQIEIEDAGAHEQAKQAAQYRVYPPGIWSHPPSESPVSSPGSSGSPVW